jgi:hypothetical protein
MGASNVDSNAKSDFSALEAKYAELQKNAYTATGTHGKGQSVKADELATLKNQIDSYINTHVSDPTKKQEMLASLDPLMGTMSTDVANQASGKTDNAGWDAATQSMESILTQVAPDGADAVWTPTSATGDGTTSGTGGTGGTDGTSDTQDLANVPSGSTDSESGTGWGGANLNLAASSKTYKGKSLDQLLADPSSIVAKEVGNQPDVVAALRKVSAQYKIPDGLLASVIIQESNGDRTNKTANSGYGDKPKDQQYDMGLVQSPLWAFPGNTTAEKEKNAEDPTQCLTMFAKELSSDYTKSGSWGVALRNWNSGGNANPNDLSAMTDGYGVSTYVKNILGHIATGSSDYGS